MVPEANLRVQHRFKLKYLGPGSGNRVGNKLTKSSLISPSHALGSEGKTWGWAPSSHLELVTLGLERRRIQMGPARV